MKKIEELSRSELQSAFTHQFQDVCFFDDQFECACCGTNNKVLFSYICDKCESDEPPSKINSICTCEKPIGRYIIDLWKFCPICGKPLEQYDHKTLKQKETTKKIKQRSTRMKVKKWISYDDSGDYKEAPCGCMGGFFKEGMRWEDYIDSFYGEVKPHIEALRKSIIENKIKLTGEEHQTIDGGVPLFSDDTAATYTYRAWGDLMAAVWSEEEDKDYCYMDFYMNWT